jgi:hydrogenase expression/formation protein HypE
MPDSLEVGKLEPRLLRQLVFNNLGCKDNRVLLEPKIGEDATVIDFGDRALVVHSDPITGTVENIGRLAVNVCTNDIATRGVRPLWILTALLLPEGFVLAHLRRIMRQIDDAARQLDVAVVGGHSEITSAVRHPVIVTTAIGETTNKKFVSSSQARVGDSLIMTKGSAIEGTSILAFELTQLLEDRIGKRMVERAKRFIKMTSVVSDALTAVEVGEVHAMHDATEGGVVGAIQEIAWASDSGAIVKEDRIPIYAETKAVCEALGIDALRTISSGTLLIAAAPESTENILAALKEKNIKASKIGDIVSKRRGIYLIRKDGTRLNLSQPVKEQLWIALKRTAKKTKSQRKS